MNKYYFRFYREKVNHAGSKAVDDCESILRSLGYKEIPLFERHKSVIVKAILRLCEIPRILIMKRGAFVFIEHPIYTHRDYFKTLGFIKRFKKLKYAFIIHDLESARRILPNNEFRAKRDYLMYEMADCMICHNSSMHRFLVNSGVVDRKIIDLECFDYLVNSNAEINTDNKPDENGIVIVGNLGRQASEFIYELSKTNHKMQLNLYGVNFDASEKGNYNYVGSFDADVLPSVICGKYGLIWYGSSLTDCGGDYKEYLPYINPHKVSCYVVAGLPVIISRNIGMAEFVKQHGIGIVVDSIENLQEVVNSITEEQYQRMKKNVDALAEKLKAGYYLKTAISQCERIVGEIE